MGPNLMVEPATLADPAFLACLAQAARDQDLVREYDRLTHYNLQLHGTPLDLSIDASSGRLDSEVAGFVQFVYDTIFLRLAPDVLQDLRDKAATGTPPGV